MVRHHSGLIFLCLHLCLRPTLVLLGGRSFCLRLVSRELDVPSVHGCNINVLELQTVLEAAKRWSSKWSGLHILVRPDNAATVAAVNQGTSRSVGMLSIIKQLFWLSVEFDFRLSAQHLPGRLNVLSDCLFRLDVVDSAVLAKSFLSVSVNEIVECADHMTYCAFLSLQEAWRGTSASYC
jgi:hypothetical protein